MIDFSTLGIGKVKGGSVGDLLVDLAPAGKDSEALNGFGPSGCGDLSVRSCRSDVCSGPRSAKGTTTSGVVCLGGVSRDDLLLLELP